MLSFIGLDFVPSPVPLIPQVTATVLFFVALLLLFFVEQRQPLLCNIGHSLEIDVDIGSVSLKTH